MKARDRRALGEYIRWCADAVGLRDWTITLVVDEPRMDVAEYDAEVIDATMECVFGQKLGVLTAPPSIRDRELHEIRHTITHELVHCHVTEVYELGCHFLRQLGPAAVAAAERGHILAMERAVDGIAREWSTHLPLIEWPD